MSHEKIIELSKTKLSKDEYVGEDYFYSGFQGWIADYVDDQVEDWCRADVITCFAEDLIREFPAFVTYDAKQEAITFKDGFNKAFSTSRIRMIKDAVKNVDEGESLSMLSYKLHTLIGDQFGTYIHEDGCTFKEAAFLRDVTPGTYFFGGVIDYHY